MRASRKPRVILVILIGLCGVFVYSYTSRLAEKSHLDTEIMAVQARIADAKIEQHKLEAELEYLNEPDYIDQVARETFDRAKPGDKVLVIVDQPAAASQAATEAVIAVAAANPIDYRNFPVWQQWVVFFTADSFTISTQ